MTKYVGEQFRIAAGPFKDYDDTVLGEDDVQGVTLLILNKDRTILVDEEPMTFDDTDGKWAYKWDAEGLTTGTYRYRVTVTGADSGLSIEWFTVRLRRQQTIVT